MSVLSISSLLLHTLLHPASAPWEAGPQEGQQWALCPLAFCPVGLMGGICQESGGVGGQESEVGVFIPLVPSPPGGHGCLPPSALWVSLPTPWGHCRQVWGGISSPLLLARMLHHPDCISKPHSHLCKYSSSSVHLHLSDWSVPSVSCQSPD